jgi:hypothetical protein
MVTKQSVSVRKNDSDQHLMNCALMLRLRTGMDHNTIFLSLVDQRNKAKDNTDFLVGGEDIILCEDLSK